MGSEDYEVDAGDVDWFETRVAAGAAAIEACYPPQHAGRTWYEHLTREALKASDEIGHRAWPPSASPSGATKEDE